MYHAHRARQNRTSSYNGRVGLSLHPERLRRYKDVARLLYRYGKSDLVRRAGLDEAIADEAFAEQHDDGKPDELAADLEQLGPAFIKLRQLLSTRADLLPPPYGKALGRLQDSLDLATMEDIADRPNRKH